MALPQRPQYKFLPGIYYKRDGRFNVEIDMVRIEGEKRTAEIGIITVTRPKLRWAKRLRSQIIELLQKDVDSNR